MAPPLGFSPAAGGGDSAGRASSGWLSARQLSDNLKRFVQFMESPQSVSSGTSLSEVGFVLLRLKEQLLSQEPRAMYFAAELSSRPANGVETLIRVIVVLQAIVNTANAQQQGSGSGGTSPSISSPSSSAGASRKRKAAVAEADCIECLKILLEKASPTSWRALLEQPGLLEIVLLSVNSPQLDSKCYALEILLLLIEQPQGYIQLLRALTAIAARSRDYLRLTLFVAQLKHGLHTQKLHIQILVVRLFNRLLSLAPTPNHRHMAQLEAALAQFSPEYVEKLILDARQPLGGLDVLQDELAEWRSLFVPTPSAGAATGFSSSIYAPSESDSDDRLDRRRPRTVYKYPTGTTTVAKNVERQRAKRQQAATASGVGADSRRHSGTLTRTTDDWDIVMQPDYTLRSSSSARWVHEGPSSPTGTLNNAGASLERRHQIHHEEGRGGRMPAGGAMMRRAKSESSMAAALTQSTSREIPSISPLPSLANRIQPRSHRPHSNYQSSGRAFSPQPTRDHASLVSHRPLSHSVHDLSRLSSSEFTSRGASSPPPPPPPNNNNTSTLRSSGQQQQQQQQSFVPQYQSRSLVRRAASPRAVAAAATLHNNSIPAEQVEARQPHAGFSYLFPQQPVVASVVRRSAAASPHSPSSAESVGAPSTGTLRPAPSAPGGVRISTGAGGVSAQIGSPPPGYEAHRRPDGEIVYLPIHYEDGRPIERQQQQHRRAQHHHQQQRSPTGDEEVRDALSQFDYLNDYETRAPNGQRSTNTTTYHF